MLLFILFPAESFKEFAELLNEVENERMMMVGHQYLGLKSKTVADNKNILSIFVD